MRVVVTGATGTIGRAVVRALLDRDDEVVALSRDARRAREALGDDVEVIPWRDPKSQPAPAERSRRCCRRSGSGWAGRWRAAASTCRGCTSTTWPAACCSAWTPRPPPEPST